MTNIMVGHDNFVIGCCYGNFIVKTVRTQALKFLFYYIVENKEQQLIFYNFFRMIVKLIVLFSWVLKTTQHKDTQLIKISLEVSIKLY